MSEPLLLRNIQTAEQAAVQRVKRLLRERNIALIVLHGQPGAGRTTLLLATEREVRETYRVAAVVASAGSPRDAETIAAAGIPVVSVEVGRIAGLDAAMVEQALDSLTDEKPQLVFVETMGCLCRETPSLGQNASVIVSAVNSALYLPLKYPKVFTNCEAIVVSMMDLAALTDFRLQDFEKAVHSLNAQAELLPLSCRAREGLEPWFRWVEGCVAPLL